MLIDVSSHINKELNCLVAELHNLQYHDFQKMQKQKWSKFHVQNITALISWSEATDVK